MFGGAFLYAVYLVAAGGVIARIGSHALHLLGDAGVDGVRAAAVRATRDPALLRVPPSIHALSLAMAVVSTVLPVWLIAESIQRIGANTSSLIGSLGPVFTIALGAAILGEPMHWVQLAGAALVLAGVMLVTLRPDDAGGPTSRAAASSGS